MYISLRVKILALLFVLISGVAIVISENSSALIQENIQETFRSRLRGVLRGITAYWKKEQNQVIRSATMFSESEKVINFSVYGLNHLLQREIKRLLANSDFQELEVKLKSGTIISATKEEIIRGKPLNLAEPSLNLSRLQLQNRNRVIQMTAIVPITKMGELLGLLTLVKKIDDDAIKGMAKVLQSDLSLTIRGEIFASSFDQEMKKDFLIAVNNQGDAPESFFNLLLGKKINAISMIDIGETPDRETIRVYAALSQRKMLSIIEQSRLQAFNLTLAALTVALILAVLFSERVLTRRIRQIRNGSNRIAGEELSFRLPAGWKDEFGDLARSFNNMAEKLQADRHKLVLQNEELQHYIKTLENMKTYIQNILGSLGTGVITWDKTGFSTMINPAAEKELENFYENLKGISLHLFMRGMHRDSRKLFLKALRALTRKTIEGQPFDLEFSGGKTQGVKIMQGGLTYLRDSAGIPHGMVLTLDNITQRKIIEQQLFHADKLSSIGQLAASVAHEIKNPLASIKTLGQLLQEETGNGDSRREYIDVIVSEVNRLNAVVEQLLKYARPDEAKFTLVRFSDLIKPVLALIHHELERSRILLETTFEENMEVYVDGEKIKQVFLNLIFNSIQAMPEGGRLKLKAFTGEKTPWSIFQLEDTGKGMSPDVVNRIFEPFFTTKQRGTGLGLAIAKKIVDHHGGIIEVKSRPDVGTTFIVSLPRERKDVFPDDLQSQ